MSMPIAAGRAAPAAPPIIRSKAANAGAMRDTTRPNPLMGEETTTPTTRPRGRKDSALTTSIRTTAANPVIRMSMSIRTTAVNPVIRMSMSIRTTAAAMAAAAVTVTTKR